MTKEEVLIELRQLSYTDKLSVLAVLNRMIELEEQDATYSEEVSGYLDKMKALAGDGFLSGKNTPENVRARIAFSICMLEKGKTLQQTGRMIGKDHSTISSYKKTWSFALAYPKLYKELIELYNNYKKAL